MCTPTLLTNRVIAGRLVVTGPEKAYMIRFGIAFPLPINSKTAARRRRKIGRRARRYRLGDRMHERIASLDDALIDRICQPAVDRLAAADRSVDCFWLARRCNDAAALAWILSQAGGVAGAFARGNVALAGAQGALVVIGLAALTTLRRVFDGTQRPRSSAGACANPLRPAMFPHRLGCLLWLSAQVLGTISSPIGWSAILTIAVGLMTTASLYVGACSTPPPRRQSQTGRNWILRPAAIRQP